MKKPKLNIKNGIIWAVLLATMMMVCGVVAIGMLTALTP